MRIADPALAPAARVAIRWNGARIEAYAGETVAAALAAAGVADLGARRDGARRGVFCGMGVCQECLVTVDGATSRRACMTKVEDGMRIDAQPYAIDVTARGSPIAPRTPVTRGPDVLIIGAGPAGLSAARAVALCGAKVTVVDERAQSGGQYFKQVASSHRVVDRSRLDSQFRAGHELIADVERLGVTMLRDTMVWGAFGPQQIGLSVGGVPQLASASQLIVAPGAYERGVPVPGWTLPGYMTTGAAQTLLRSYRVAPGMRVLIAGNGPLNFQVAAELVAAGVDVVAVVEAAVRPIGRRPGDLWRAGVASPGLVRAGLGYLARLRRAGVPIRYRSAVIAARGEDRVRECVVARIDKTGHAIRGSETTYAVDAVCTGYGFLPSVEVTRALGCRHVVRPDDGALMPVVDPNGATSIPNVYAIGDGVALQGAHAAQCQGWLAGCAAVRALGLPLSPAVEAPLARAKRDLERHRAFQSALWKLFAAPALRLQLSTPDTLLCRCECVSREAVEEAVRDGAASVGAVKRRTRAGMGRCQGRYCEPLIGAVLAATAASAPGADSNRGLRDELSSFAPRAPTRPVRIGDLL